MEQNILIKTNKKNWNVECKKILENFIIAVFVFSFCIILARIYCKIKNITTSIDYGYTILNVFKWLLFAHSCICLGLMIWKIILETKTKNIDKDNLIFNICVIAFIVISVILSVINLNFWINLFADIIRLSIFIIVFIKLLKEKN